MYIDDFKDFTYHQFHDGVGRRQLTALRAYLRCGGIYVPPESHTSVAQILVDVTQEKNGTSSHRKIPRVLRQTCKKGLFLHLRNLSSNQELQIQQKHLFRPLRLYCQQLHGQRVLELFHLLHLSRNQYLSTFNTGNCQSSIRNAKSEFRTLQSQVTLLNLQPAGTARKTSVAGIRTFVS